MRFKQINGTFFNPNLSSLEMYTAGFAVTQIPTRTKMLYVRDSWLTQELARSYKIDECTSRLEEMFTVIAEAYGRHPTNGYKKQLRKHKLTHGGEMLQEMENCAVRMMKYYWTKRSFDVGAVAPIQFFSAVAHNAFIQTIHRYSQQRLLERGIDRHTAYLYDDAKKVIENGQT